MVSKLLKIGERLGQPERQKDKDALDVFRLLRATTARTLGERHLMLLHDQLAAPTTAEAISLLRAHFAVPGAAGCQMAARAAAPLEDENLIAQSCALLADDLSEFLRAAGA